MDYVVPKGESRRAMQARAYEVWQEIVTIEPNEPTPFFRMAARSVVADEAVSRRDGANDQSATDQHLCHHD